MTSTTSDDAQRLAAPIRLAVRLRPCGEGHQPDGSRRDDAELVDRSIAELRRLWPREPSLCRKSVVIKWMACVPCGPAGRRRHV
ncbi:hypothetical protein [Nonomuraea sp. NPDC049709]|uniref:hypothetical protein n=1 Tax=Nonomuraea sp. NPDC049709 TaxID=3154736 RepID=UPI00341D6EB3